ncbi:MAG: 4Fe-4S dicluster domain-containing protein [Candidatus Acetothermia bacterium]
MKTDGKTATTKDGTLLLDLDVCDGFDCESCEVQCDNQAHPGNNGVLDLREQATFAHYCRECEDQACLRACPVDALEKNDEGLVERANLLCIGCDSCVMACPFGTIYTDFIPFLDSSCDLCEGREGEPSCVSTCPHDGLKLVPAGHEPKGEDWHELRDGLMVHVSGWQPKTLGRKGGK